jgi:hypothetical protein
MKLLFIFAIILSLLFRCQAKTETPKPEPYETTASPLPPQSEPQNLEEQSELKSSRTKNYEEPPAVSTVKYTSPSLLPAKLIRHAYLRLQVKDYAASTKALIAYIKKRNAFISNSEEDRANGTLENSLTIRVTDENFEPLVQDLLQESVYLEQKTITAKDVTEESVDIDTRLKSRKKVEERYLALLARAKNVKEILAIETELKSIQEEIESAAARQQYLQNQVAYSTITLDYFQTTTPTHSPDNSIAKRIAQALVAGWESTVAVFLLLLQLWPVGLLVALMITIYLKIRKTRLAVANSSEV